MPYEFDDENGKTRGYRTNFQTTKMDGGRRVYTCITPCGQEDCGELNCAVEANRTSYSGCFFLRGGLFMLGGIAIFVYNLLTFMSGVYGFKSAIYGIILGLMMMVLWVNRVLGYRRDYAELMEIRNTGRLSARKIGKHARAYKIIALALIVWFIYGFYIEVGYDRELQHYNNAEASHYHSPWSSSTFEKYGSKKPVETLYFGKSIAHSLLRGAGIIETKYSYI